MTTNDWKRLMMVCACTAALAGCAGKGWLGTEPGTAGDKPDNIEEAVRAELARTLKDPGSLQQLDIGFERLSACAVGIYGSFHGWSVPVTYNAKNSYGGYVGAKQYYFWFRSGRLVGVSETPHFCPEGGAWR